MKKLLNYSFILVLSLVFSLNVEAGTFRAKKDFFKFEDVYTDYYSVSKIYTTKDKFVGIGNGFYFFNRDLNNIDKVDKTVDEYAYNSLDMGDYYLVEFYDETLATFDKAGNKIIEKKFDISDFYDFIKYGDLTLVLYYDHPNFKLGFIDKDLNIVKSGIPDGANLNNVASLTTDGKNIVYKHYLDGLNVIDGDFNLLKQIKLPEEYSINSFELFGDDDLMIIYSTGDNVFDLKRFVARYNIKGEVIWEKEIKVPYQGYYTYNHKTINKLNNGNYLVTFGSIYEIDKNGNIINSCPRCVINYPIVNEEDNFYMMDRKEFEEVIDMFGNGGSLKIFEYEVHNDVSITLKDSENGRLRVNREKPKPGEEVIVSLRPQVGYEYGKLTIVTDKKDNVEFKKVSDKKYSFVMPNESVTIEVLYKKIDKQ